LKHVERANERQQIDKEAEHDRRREAWTNGTKSVGQKGGTFRHTLASLRLHHNKQVQFLLRNRSLRSRDRPPRPPNEVSRPRSLPENS